MSIRIALEVRRTPDLRRSSRRQLYLYRLYSRIRFQTLKGWTEDHLAIVDTGAPYSLIPASLALALKSKTLIRTPVRGIGAGTQLEARLSKVHCRFLDAKRSSPILSLWAMLAETDQVPLILGWAGCLDRAKLTLNGLRNQAWLEF